MTSVLVVAQCPTPSTPPGAPALTGSPSGRRLARLCGLDADADLHALFAVVNLLPAHPGPAWPLREARDRAEDLTWGHAGVGRVVLLGAAVRDAFTWDRPGRVPAEPFAWGRQGGTWWAWSPHPSGLSRAWNRREVLDGGATFWRALADQAAHPAGGRRTTHQPPRPHLA